MPRRLNPPPRSRSGVLSPSLGPHASPTGDSYVDDSYYHMGPYPTGPPSVASPQAVASQCASAISDVHHPVSPSSAMATSMVPGGLSGDAGMTGVCTDAVTEDYDPLVIPEGLLEFMRQTALQGLTGHAVIKSDPFSNHSLHPELFRAETSEPDSGTTGMATDDLAQPNHEASNLRHPVPAKKSAKKISALEAWFKTLEKWVVDLKGWISELEGRNAELKVRNAELEDRNAELEGRIAKLEAKQSQKSEEKVLGKRKLAKPTKEATAQKMGERRVNVNEVVESLWQGATTSQNNRSLPKALESSARPTPGPYWQ